MQDLQETQKKEITALTALPEIKKKHPGGRPPSRKGNYKHPYTPYDFNFAKMAERLKAAGLSDDDLAYIFGIGDVGSMHRWRVESPEFKDACKQGKEIAIRNLLASGFRMAKGYDYEETAEKWVQNKNDPEGKLKLFSRHIYKKYQPPDSAVFHLLLGNLDRRWRRPSQGSIEIGNQQNINIGIKFNGALDSKRIEQLANRLLPKDTEDSPRKSVVSTEVIA